MTLHGEEKEDEGYSSSNRESRYNSRSATPVGPEEDDTHSPSSSLRLSQKKKKKQGKTKLEPKKVIPQAGAAWKGMQGDLV